MNTSRYHGVFSDIERTCDMVVFDGLAFTVWKCKKPETGFVEYGA